MAFIPAPVVSFLAKPLVKYLGGALLVGIVLWIAVAKFNNWKDSIREEGRLAGRAEVTQEFQAIVDENNKVNRRVEKRVDEALTGFVTRLESTLDRVRGQSAQIAGDINQQIKRNPEKFNNQVCVTPKDTIESRNAIRALGPKPRRAPLATEGASEARADGSIRIELPAAE
jgi:vacuolar-type H+-ATPase subunit E/Vma4